jgi:hypothetical protein
MDVTATITIAILLVGVGIAIAVQRALSRPNDVWMQDLLNDVRNLKDETMTIAISQADLDLLNAGKSVTMQGPIVIVPPGPSEPLPPYWVYQKGKFNWNGDWSFNGKAIYDSPNDSVFSPEVIAFSVTGQWGGWLPYLLSHFETKPYAHIEFSLKPTKDNQKWSVYAVAASDTSDGHAVDVLKYGPAPIIGMWGHYIVPLADLQLTNTAILKFAIQDQTGEATNEWFVDNVGFTN